MNRMSWVVIAALAGLAGCSTAEARDYTRSCNVSISVVNQNRNMPTVIIARFSAMATASTYIPNTLRLRAYRRANSCLNWAWSRRDQSAIPEACTASNGISGYNVRHLGLTISRVACRDWGYARRSRTRVAVRGHIWGNKGCGGSRRKTDATVTLATNHLIYCS